MPAITLAKYHELMNGTTTATHRLRPAASLDAWGSGRYSSSRAAVSTRTRVGRATFGRPRSARLTVATETPAATATSWIVGRSPLAGRDTAGLPGDIWPPYRVHRCPPAKRSPGGERPTQLGRPDADGHDEHEPVDGAPVHRPPLDAVGVDEIGRPVRPRRQQEARAVTTRRRRRRQELVATPARPFDVDAVGPRPGHRGEGHRVDADDDDGRGTGSGNVASSGGRCGS